MHQSGQDRAIAGTFCFLVNWDGSDADFATVEPNVLRRAIQGVVTVIKQALR